MYQYNAKLLNVVDGDTLDMDVDMGFNVRIKQRLRLMGINTAELNSTDPVQNGLALRAKEFVENNLSIGNSYVIHTYKDDKYGRLLAIIHLDASMASINSMLIEKGLAEVYRK